MDASPSLSQKPQIPLKYPGREFPSRPTAEEYYVNYPNPGRLIIFNQYEFENSPEDIRDGTNKDLEKLKESFSRIGYAVSDYTNRRTRDLKLILKEGKIFICANFNENFFNFSLCFSFSKFPKRITQTTLH